MDVQAGPVTVHVDPPAVKVPPITVPVPVPTPVQGILDGAGDLVGGLLHPEH